LHVDAQVLLVPSAQRDRIPALEEDPTDTRDSLHVRLQSVMDAKRSAQTAKVGSHTPAHPMGTATELALAFHLSTFTALGHEPEAK